MKILSGVDIIEINRIQKCISKNNNKFLEKIYTQKEIEYCESRNIQKYQSYAARFAAKEAAYKALSEYIGSDCTWKDFEIINNEKGKPMLKLHFTIPYLKNLELTLSHCKEYAVAQVVGIYDEN